MSRMKVKLALRMLKYLKKKWWKNLIRKNMNRSSRRSVWKLKICKVSYLPLNTKKKKTYSKTKPKTILPETKRSNRSRSLSLLRKLRRKTLKILRNKERTSMCLPRRKHLLVIAHLILRSCIRTQTMIICFALQSFIVRILI